MHFNEHPSCRTLEEAHFFPKRRYLALISRFLDYILKLLCRDTRDNFGKAKGLVVDKVAQHLIEERVRCISTTSWLGHTWMVYCSRSSHSDEDSPAFF